MDSLERIGRVSGSAMRPADLGNLAAVYITAAQRSISRFKADWHWVAERFSEDPLTRPLDNPAMLPAYNYFNFGAGFVIPDSGTRINARSAERIPEQGPGGGQPAAAVGRRRAGLPGPAAPAAPAAGVGELRLRRRRARQQPQ